MYMQLSCTYNRWRIPKSTFSFAVATFRYYGGWVAPNIYFLGFAGVVKFGNIRIAGLSGIYKANHYRLGYYEKLPYNDSDIRSIYHVREYAVHKLMQVEEPIDIFLSHDWPIGITDHGDWQQLVRFKPFFKQEIQERTLGSKPAAELLGKLKPAYWFSAHLHCKFSALVQHGEGGPTTKFIALDKCLPGRKFLQIVDIDSESGPYEIQYDEEWLAITRKLNPDFPLTATRTYFREVPHDMQAWRQWVRDRLQARGAKPFQFEPTVPPYNPAQSTSKGAGNGSRNPQTEAFLKFLELPYLLDHASQSMEQHRNPSPSLSRGLGSFDNDSDVDEVEESADLSNEED